eukprot:CAMPEP_0173415006 /NCGR_PEP_ID=MMETSP1356-20130122/84630_1 /TAXON_ID=77927 ORGANISM="Hemiselmis virescens, Strain PCC157" /NCGR_SAMPLE_ID=MMETSP1356 /ASSEMBLY_ACC=CAM_ASM_000847 /LENGTH=214 /DNA_ID=CAMNT_0014377227 /DNA_START=702 /DNA_END=1343 /DNA_ORIENTATION=+
MPFSSPQSLDMHHEQDVIKAPEDPEMLVPYWEKQPLPARPGTSSRRQQKEAKQQKEGGEKKLVVYKTEKTKKLEAQARKKREEDAEGGPSPEKAPEKKKTSKKAGSSLPPIKQRKKIHAGAAGDFGDFEVLTPGKKGQDGGSSNGQQQEDDSWTVRVPPAPVKKELSAIAEVSREGSSTGKMKAPADVMTLDASPVRGGPETLAFALDLGAFSP